MLAGVGSGFHFSMPLVVCWLPRYRRGWTIAQRRVRPDRVVVDAPSPASTDQQAPPRVLVDQIQQPHRSTIVGARAHEIVAPDMVLVLWQKPHARPVVEPQPPSCFLFLRNLQP